MNQNQNPVSALAATEKQLASAIHTTASALDNVGTTRIDEAMERLHASAEAAKQRMLAAHADLLATVQDVLGCMHELTADLTSALLVNAMEEQSPIIPTVIVPQLMVAPAMSVVTEQEPTERPAHSEEEIATMAANSLECQDYQDSEGRPIFTGSPMFAEPEEQEQKVSTARQRSRKTNTRKTSKKTSNNG